MKSKIQESIKYVYLREIDSLKIIATFIKHVPFIVQ